MLVITWSSSLNLPYKLVLTDDVINHHLLRAADVPPDKLEAECSLPAAVQPELGALVRGVSGPGCGGGCPAHLARAGAQHLAFIEHHPKSEWDQLGAQRRAAVDGAVRDVGGRCGVRGGESHPPATPPVAVADGGGGTCGGRLSSLELNVIICSWRSESVS